MDGIKGEIVIVAGIALAVIYLGNQAAAAASKGLSDAADAARRAASEAWEAAKQAGAQVIDATAETVTPAGAGLYDPRPTKTGAPKTQYSLGSIEDGTVF